MTNTPMTFEEWWKSNMTDPTIGIIETDPKSTAESSWQACQEHNDAVIAELVEALESMIRENISNREYAPEDILYEITQENKAQKLIAKHKKGTE